MTIERHRHLRGQRGVRVDRAVVGDGHGADIDKLNVNGGAIALGHPVGATGSRLHHDRAARARARATSSSRSSPCAAAARSRRRRSSRGSSAWTSPSTRRRGPPQAVARSILDERRRPSGSARSSLRRGHRSRAVDGVRAGRPARRRVAGGRRRQRPRDHGARRPARGGRHATSRRSRCSRRSRSGPCRSPHSERADQRKRLLAPGPRRNVVADGGAAGERAPRSARRVQTTATRDGSAWRLDGHRRWPSRTRRSPSASS